MVGTQIHRGDEIEVIPTGLDGKWLLPKSTTRTSWGQLGLGSNPGLSLVHPNQFLVPKIEIRGAKPGSGLENHYRFPMKTGPGWVHFSLRSHFLANSLHFWYKRGPQKVVEQGGTLALHGGEGPNLYGK